MSSNKVAAVLDQLLTLLEGNEPKLKEAQEHLCQAKKETLLALRAVLHALPGDLEQAPSRPARDLRKIPVEDR